jgi:predicted membrane-bound spermidine synthase
MSTIRTGPTAVEARHRKPRASWIPLLFFCSGFPALIYQIVWQRALFAVYGINVQSVTIVVSGFMLGLGMGGLLGGALSKRKRVPLVVVFAIAELGTGVFGFFSLTIFHHVAEFTAGASLLTTAVVSFSLVVLPTLLMGTTLPVLIQHLINSSGNVGYSVGLLYFANTLGSGLSCFLVADVLMLHLGQSGSVRFATVINVLVAAAAVVANIRLKQTVQSPSACLFEVDGSKPGPLGPAFSFSFALICAAVSRFIALSYEIVWFRLLAFATWDTAPAFALLLGAYLVGVAIGSRFMERRLSSASHRLNVGVLARLLFAASICSFAAAPFSAVFMKFASPAGNFWTILPLTFSIIIATAFFGATFPAIAHASVDSVSQAGKALSQLYAANIAGSTAGTIVVGFILTDHLSARAISLLLLLTGLLLAAAVYTEATKYLARRKIEFLIGAAMVIFVVAVSTPVLGTIYDRLLFKNRYPNLHFQHIVENRSGVIGATPEGVVWGGGVYDGRFNIDLLHDLNIIVRPYSLSAVHAAPRRVLMIGLGSGSWAQVIANHPQVEELTIVEINPGYLRLIPGHAEVASLLRNPKVHITIDDGRRWLLGNNNETFDAVLMNTSYYWRNHSSNLLSVEFLQIVRKHLNCGAVFLYNTTGSDDVVATGLSVFPYGLRIVNALVVSDAPLALNRARWKAVLMSYVIDARHVVDVNDPKQITKLDEIVNIPEDPTGVRFYSVENNDELRARLKNRLVITDDNMGLEWRATPHF